MSAPTQFNKGRTRDLRAEFDAFADEYHTVHQRNIAITGEQPEFFAEYKISDVAALLGHRATTQLDVLDFGSGIGNSIPHFRIHLPAARLSCADISARSLALAAKRFPGEERYLLIEDTIPISDESVDVVFSACVFHHIPHTEHGHWFAELRRVLRPGGLLVIFEHNPLNPLTVRAVNTCPLDVNAHLISAGALRSRLSTTQWHAIGIRYRIFFPSLLRRLRPLERQLMWLPFGAQYRLQAWRT